MRWPRPAQRSASFPTPSAEAIASACADADALQLGRAAGRRTCGRQPRRAARARAPCPRRRGARALRPSRGDEPGRARHRGDARRRATRSLSCWPCRRGSRACATLAREHRSTPMAARTLLQQAVPTTFGLVAAGWLVALLDARARLADVAESGLAVQLGGAAGTLSALGDDGVRIVDALARELEPGRADAAVAHEPRARRRARRGARDGRGSLREDRARRRPALPDGGGRGARGRGWRLVGDAAEAEPGAGDAGPLVRGARRARMPPCSRHSLVQEHQRAAGAWHAEWEALCGALMFAGAPPRRSRSRSAASRWTPPGCA